MRAGTTALIRLLQAPAAKIARPRPQVCQRLREARTLRGRATHRRRRHLRCACPRPRGRTSWSRSCATSSRAAGYQRRRRSRGQQVCQRLRQARTLRAELQIGRRRALARSRHVYVGVSRVDTCAAPVCAHVAHVVVAIVRDVVESGRLPAAKIARPRCHTCGQARCFSSSRDARLPTGLSAPTPSANAPGQSQRSGEEEERSRGRSGDRDTSTWAADAAWREAAFARAQSTVAPQRGRDSDFKLSGRRTRSSRDVGTSRVSTCRAGSRSISG